jgi:hypothetical protein
VVFRCRGAGVAVVAAVAALSCRRALPLTAHDAGREGGGPAIVDAATEAIDVPRPDAAPDAAIDARSDGAADLAADGGTDAIVDAAAAICPAGVAPLEVCGCGCCGGVTEGVWCYYPARGETRDAIPNPMPPPEECARQGCIDGELYVCCADPGPQADAATICAIDTSIEDQARFTVTRRDGDVCTTLELGSAAPILPITGPPGLANTSAWRGPCDGSAPRVYAIGGLGRVTPGTAGTLPRYDVHVVLFFGNRTGIAEAVRIDRDAVAVASRCTSGTCPACGDVCQLDATYSFTTAGGLVPFREATVVAPPASFTFVRKPEAATGTLMSCTPGFPACGGPAIDVADVIAAFADPDVQAAFAVSMSGMRPFYGVNDIATDAPAFEFQREGGAVFFIGSPCPAGSPQSCTPIPAGLTRLLSFMARLDQQQLADPSCAFARP